MRSLRRRRARIRKEICNARAIPAKPADVASSNNLPDAETIHESPPPKKFKPVFPKVADKANENSLEREFVKVLVERGIGRKTSNELFSVLRKFNVGSFPCDLRKASGTAREVQVVEMCQGFFHYFGIQSSLSRALMFFKLNEGCEIYLQFNFDGLPIHKSTSKCFWPILCRARINMKYTSVFLVGLFCGKGKPEKSSVFLRQFLDELRELNGNLLVNKVSCSLKVECFICDTPARSFVKHVKGHGGYGSCERCTVRGDCVAGKIKFIERDCPLRTDISFRQQHDLDHHHDTCSPLLELSVDMVKDFPLDYMHLVLLGVVRKLSCHWFPSVSKRSKRNPLFHLHVVGGVNFKTVNDRALLCARFTPNEFQRRPRSFTELNYFKATEFRNIVCYLFPFIFRNVFPQTVVFDHFLLLFVAMRILLTPNNSVVNIQYARSLLVKFVKDGGKVYTDSFYVNNVHALLHLADDYDRFGCLDNVSSFPFENYMSKLKRFVKRPGKELQQVVKRVKERDEWVLPVVANADEVTLNYRHNSGPSGPFVDNDGEYLQVDAFGKRLRVCSNDDTVFTAKGYCCVVNVVLVGNQVWLGVRKYSSVTSMFGFPCDSKKVGVVKCVGLSKDVLFVNIREACKCLKVVGCEFVYVVKLLHEKF